MKITISTIELADLEVDVLTVLGFADDKQHRELVATLVGDEVGEGLSDFGGKAGETQLLYSSAIRARRLLLVGCGDTETSTEKIRVAAAKAAAFLANKKFETVGLVVPETKLGSAWTSQSIVEGFVLGSYSFDRYRTSKGDETSPVQRLVLTAETAKLVERGRVERGRIVSESVCFARDLVNLPPVDKTAALLANHIQECGKRNGFDVETWGPDQIKEEKMGGLLAVNRGSTEPPTFSIMEWKPEMHTNKRPVVLVGKGVVYDTGGLSLKPTKDSMDYMKSDMAGAAAVVATMEVVSRLQLPLHVIGLVPASDNRPGVNAYVPGDVVHMRSGKTVEVLNTDAEGRMLLADALSYADEYDPELVIDLATLTGAAVVALGKNIAAIMTNQDLDAAGSTDAFVAAGKLSGERVHPLPMDDDYADQLKSTIADLKNVGGRPAGTITAAKFLENFVNYPWVHIDIAGPSFVHKADSYRKPGGTGFGVRLLTEFLINYTARQ